MKPKNKLTDEQLASLIESGFGKSDIGFSDIDDFEAFMVAENAMQLVEEEELLELDFSMESFSFNDTYEPLAMCAFLGDEDIDDDIDNDNIESDDSELNEEKDS